MPGLDAAGRGEEARRHEAVVGQLGVGVVVADRHAALEPEARQPLA